MGTFTPVLPNTRSGIALPDSFVLRAKTADVPKSDVCPRNARRESLFGSAGCEGKGCLQELAAEIRA